MADFEKVSLSDDELDVLSNNDFAEIARKGRIDGEISAEELRTVTAETMVRFKGYLANNSTITGMTKETLDGLKTIVVSGSAVVIDPPLDIPGQGGTVGDVAPSISAPKVLPDELSPTTTFDVIRLIQLGYIPIEAPTNPKGTIKRHVMNTPKWIFVGLQKANEWGAKITTNKMIDLFKPAGSHIGYRAQLDKDITDLHTELKSYQATTKESFEFKAELEKQLSLLEQMRSEKDPKALQSITKQYFDSRTKTHFTV